MVCAKWTGCIRQVNLSLVGKIKGFHAGTPSCLGLLLICLLDCSGIQTSTLITVYCIILKLFSIILLQTLNHIIKQPGVHCLRRLVDWITPLTLYQVICLQIVLYSFYFYHILILADVPSIMYLCYVLHLSVSLCCCNKHISPLEINKVVYLISYQGI